MSTAKPTEVCRPGNAFCRRKAYKMDMTDRIGPKHPPRIYVREWRMAKGLDQSRLGDRIGVNKAQISNWENGRRRPSGQNQAALAAALGIEVVDLFRHPDRPSCDELLRDVPPDVYDQVIRVVKAMVNGK